MEILVSKNSSLKQPKNRLVVDNSDDESISSIENKEEREKLNSSESEESEFVKQFEFLLEKITKNYKEQRDEIRNLIKLHKKELKCAKKTKRTRNQRDKTGFTKPEIVPDKLADFVDIKRGTMMSRTELTKLLCKEFTKRNLYYKNDKRVIIPDELVKNLFNLPNNADKSINPRDKDGLNFYNLQTYIAKCYNEFKNKDFKIIDNKINDYKNKEIKNHETNGKKKIKIYPN